MSDEKIAFKITRLYFQEIARMGYKRKLDLDNMISAYFYVLEKLKDKDKVMQDLCKKACEDENKKKVDSQEASTKKDQKNDSEEKSVLEILSED